MERKFTIYQIVSKGSGKSYIGCTKQKLSERWRQHVLRAFREQYASPLYEAIRTEGRDGFSILALEEAHTLEDGYALESKYIAVISPDMCYNQSKGGLDDASAGSKKAWGNINRTPETRAAYIKKLSEVKKANDHTDYADLQRKGEIWRKNNPKIAYKMSARALRIANRKRVRTTPKADAPLKERLLLKHKNISLSKSRGVAKMWANRSAEQRAAVSANIAKAKQDYWRTNAVLPDFDPAQWPYAKATVLRKIRQGFTRDGIILDAVNNVKSKGSHWKESLARLRGMGVPV